MLEFMQDLQEARMTRNENNQRVLTYTDCCERLYLSLLVIDLLRRFPKYFRAAQNYSHLTTRYPNYKSFKYTSNYFCCYFIFSNFNFIYRSFLQDIQNLEKKSKTNNL